jgi:plasmid stabilization system protein ParE
MKFEILTPLGFTVRTSESYWQRLITKHPDIADLEELVQQALAAPDEIRRSSRDDGVLVFYLSRSEKRWVVAVARRLNGDGFLITAYQTDAIKEGESIWHR